MTKYKNILILYILILLEILIIINSKIIVNNIINTSNIFITRIFPSLFPNMIIGSMITKCNLTLIIPNKIKILFNKLFNFDENETIIYITSMICGVPNNAIFINNYLEKGLITNENAEYLLYITSFINPLFIIYTVGISIFNNIKIGLLIIILLYLSSMIKAFFLRKHFINNKSINKKITNINYYNELINTINTSISSCLLIFGIIILFSILISLINEIFNLNPFLSFLVNGILEVTSGINLLSTLNISNISKFILSYIILSFNGISIHMQTLSMIKEKKISYLKYLIFKV